MAQITIYVDDETDRKAREAAAQAGQSVSAWVSGLIRNKVVSEWPPEVLALFGSWKDEEVQFERSDVPDLPREPL